MAMGYGDRVAPYGGNTKEEPPAPAKESKEKKNIGLPRAAPLVQPKNTTPQEGQRTRVSADGAADTAATSPKRSAGGIGSKRAAKAEGPSQSALGGLAASKPSSSSSGEAEQESSALAGLVSMRTKVSEERLEAYRKLAAQKCGEAVEAAKARADKKRMAKRPKHVWWGFHYFWPREVLEGTVEQDPMDDVHVRPEYRARTTAPAAHLTRCAMPLWRC